MALSSDGSLAGDLGLTVTLAGQDARFTVDGIAATSATNRVADAIPGVDARPPRGHDRRAR